MKFKISLISIMFVLLAGCASSIKSYSGKTLSLAESGILTCEGYLRINAIDGDTSKVIASGGGLWFRDCVVSLTPGEHTVTFQYSTGGTVSMSTGNVTHKINVEKGNIYRIKYTLEGSKWKPWIEKLKGAELNEQRVRVMSKLK